MNSAANTKIVDVIIMIIIGITSLLCLVPMIHLLALSFSSNGAIMAGKITLFPIGFNLTAFKAVFLHSAMIRSLIFTIFLVALFTAIAMFMTVIAAYPLTKPSLKGRNFFLIVIVLTMFFSGGLIPDYLLMRELHLLDSIWVLVLPGSISAFYLIILKSFFSSIPLELEESSRMDGAGHFRILWSIILPLSLPSIATLSLFYAVGRWNGFQDALIYITSPNLYPIQLKLYALVISGQANDMSIMEAQNAGAPVPQSLKAASIMFGTVPILLVYPFIQRYFISGVMIGAVKG
ncbi:putative aldouronate transport system permease protein [Paenibacillus castaneae]|uniref:carbohydrate ABC transporter permease n=1 Tax=Paenibacillus castaneae TaxID=474957 RepID=UPI000C9B0699|nr:carbohydrate ABC transporter permease [Paenibacillus castaneae]NIK77791.1 putative aldouronate transport system permease protein [Paenibacillus castaneae]